jgi:hypothetical protein
MMGPQLEPAVDKHDDVQMNQVSAPSVAYVVTLKKMIKFVEMINQNLQRRIMDLEDRMLRITKITDFEFSYFEFFATKPN